MTLLPVGTRVRMNVKKWVFVSNPVTPEDIGTIKYVYKNQEFCYHIVWDNGHSNGYKKLV